MTITRLLSFFNQALIFRDKEIILSNGGSLLVGQQACKTWKGNKEMLTSKPKIVSYMCISGFLLLYNIKQQGPFTWERVPLCRRDNSFVFISLGDTKQKSYPFYIGAPSLMWMGAKFEWTYKPIKCWLKGNKPTQKGIHKWSSKKLVHLVYWFFGIQGLK